MTKSQANFMLAKTLLRLVKKYPDLRFSQILQNFNFVEVKEVTEIIRLGQEHISLYWEDEFYLESEDLLERVSKEKK